jgi:hypothetical protein
MTVEGAERLPQHEAHAMRAGEAAKVGEHRVQMVPNSKGDPVSDVTKSDGSGERPDDSDDRSGEQRCEMCGEPAEELSQRIDVPGIVDRETGNYRARWVCASCGG